MYIVNRRWLYTTLIVCAISIVFYVIYAIRDIPRGGSFTGYVLGILGTVLLLLLMLLPVRKRQYQRPVGSLDVWMRSHVCLGIITVVIVGMHTGFQVIGTVSIGLSVVFILTLVSGIIGTVLYETLPNTIARMGNNTFRQQSLLENLSEMEQELEEMLTGQSDQFRDVVTQAWTRNRYPSSLNPLHLVPWWIRRFRMRKEIQDTGHLTELEQAIYPAVEVLIIRYEQLDRQLFYQRIIRQWLWSHIPFSAALLTLLLVHIVTKLYY